MKRLYEFAACIFMPIKDEKLKRHSVLICEDADGALFIMDKQRVLLPDSVEYDPIKFKVKNGLFDDNCKIFLN